jgi:hypothetical protein
MGEKESHRQFDFVWVLASRRPALRGQDFSSIGFSLGTNLATVLKHTDKKMADEWTHEGLPLFQEMTWWPPNIPGPSFRADSVEQILFSFYNGQLYKISVAYDQASTEGLTSKTW